MVDLCIVAERRDPTSLIIATKVVNVTRMVCERSGIALNMAEGKTESQGRKWSRTMTGALPS